MNTEGVNLNVPNMGTRDVSQKLMTTYDINQDAVNMNLQSPEINVESIQYGNLQGVDIQSNQSTPQINVQDSQTDIPSF